MNLRLQESRSDPMNDILNKIYWNVRQALGYFFVGMAWGIILIGGTKDHEYLISGLSIFGFLWNFMELHIKKG